MARPVYTAPHPTLEASRWSARYTYAGGWPFVGSGDDRCLTHLTHTNQVASLTMSRTSETDRGRRRREELTRQWKRTNALRIEDMHSIERSPAVPGCTPQSCEVYTGCESARELDEPLQKLWQRPSLWPNDPARPPARQYSTVDTVSR